MAMKSAVVMGFGMLFGFLLCWLGFIHYDTIFNALLLRDLYLWKVFVTGVIVGGLGLWTLKRTSAQTWLTREAITWDRMPVVRSNVIGGAIFGLGWVIAGTCPGPALAQIGSGNLSGLLTAFGIFAGIALRDRTSEG
jgi:uncharacterized protein